MSNALLHRAMLFTLGITSLIVTAPALFAQDAKPVPKYAISVTADRTDALYKQGETVTFKIQLQQDGQPLSDAPVQWTITKDGVSLNQSGKLTLTNGIATVTSALKESGFLQCRASFTTNKTTVSGLGGAGIDPLQIKPSLPVPDDFDAFWAGKKKQLAAVSMNPRLTPVKSAAADVEAFDAQVDSVGAPVSAYFAKPMGAKPKSLPIILTVHGAGVRSSGLGGTVGWAKQGFLAMDMNAHGIPNGKPDEFYKALAEGELKDYSRRAPESRETIYFLGMFLRLVRAIDFLTAQPEWDGKIVIVHGTSQGGAQSIVAAGIDSRVTYFVPGVPAMCDHTGVAVNRVNGWPHFLPNGGGAKPDPKALEAVRYYDAMNFATRTRAGSYWTVGFIDTTCAPTSVYAAYNNATGEKGIFNDVKSGHMNTPAAGTAMREAILKYVASQKKSK
ncbi:MAG TPA: acetylxylan esterase [Roseimicrobium sp.]|nr:acetylxylan esterase [Roseimicrobium sp.]